MHEARVHIAMDGNSYTEYREAPSTPGGFIAIFHPQFVEEGYLLPQLANPAEPEQASRLTQLLRQAFEHLTGEAGVAPSTGSL